MSIRAVSFDAAGTLLHVAEPVAVTYARAARAHGVDVGEEAVAARFPAAFAVDWEGCRMDGDGRPFWRHVVATCTGSDDEVLFEALYAYYGLPAAWRVEPGTIEALDQLRTLGQKRAILSNWDTRLGPLLDALGLAPHVDFIGISGVIGVEKPDSGAFRSVAEGLGLPLSAVLHVGDSARADVAGARAAGAHALPWTGFSAVFERLSETR